MTLIEGGFSNRPHRSRPGSSKRRGKRRTARTARAAAPLLIPLALALTLGVILAVSSAPAPSHVQQTTVTGRTNP